MPRLRTAKLGLSRRSLIAAGAGAALGLPAFLGSGRAQGRKIKFTLSWLAEGLFAYVYDAKARGYWRDRGLDVEISRGYGSMVTPPLIASGSFDFGVAAVPAVVLNATKGIDLRALAVMDYDSAMGVAVLDGSPIKEPKDLEGKKVGQTLSSNDSVFFAPFCAKNGVDLKSITIQNVDARVREQALLRGEVDAITGFAGSVLASVASSGQKVRFLLYSDYGVQMYGNSSLLAPPATVEREPDLCQAIADGLLEGMRYSLVSPDRALDDFVAQVPELGMTPGGRTFASIGMALQRFSVLSAPDAKLHGLGWSESAKLDETADFVMKYQAAPGAARPDMAKIYGNRFVGRIRMTDAEWSKAEAQTSGVTAMLRKRA